MGFLIGKKSYNYHLFINDLDNEGCVDNCCNLLIINY